MPDSVTTAIEESPYMDLINNCVLVPEWVLGQCHNVSSALPGFVVRSWNLVGSYSVCDTGVQQALSSGPQYAWGEFDTQKVAILLLQPCEFSLTLRSGPARRPQFMGDISVCFLQAAEKSGLAESSAESLRRASSRFRGLFVGNGRIEVEKRLDISAHQNDLGTCSRVGPTLPLCRNRPYFKEFC